MLFGLNDLVGYVSADGSYTPFSGSTHISAAVWDETVNYAAGASRFMRTGSVYSGDVKEASGFDPVQTPASNVLIGGLGWVLGSLEWAWMILHALLPALAWIVLYRFARLFASRLPALAVAWAAALAAFGTQQLLLVGPNPFQQPLELQRLPEPALSFPVLLLAAHFLARGLGEDDRRRLVAGGLLAGGLAYVYYFYWVSAVAGLGLLLLLAVLLRTWALARRLGLAALSAAAVAAPYVVLSLLHRHSAVVRRNASLSHHLPPSHLLVLVLLVLAGVALALWRPWSERLIRGDTRTWATRTIAAFVIGGVVGANAQLVIGYDVSSGHFLQRVIKPLLVLAVLLLVASAVERLLPSRRLLAALAVVGVLPLVVLGVVRQVEVARRTLPAHRTTTARLRLLAWMRDHVPVRDVVATTDRELIAEIPAVTGNFLFVPDGGKAGISRREIVVRYIAAARLEGWGLGRAEAAARERPEDGQHAFVNIAFLFHDRGRLERDVRTLWPVVDVRNQVRAHELDYLVAQSASVPDSVRRLFPSARIVHLSGSWALIRLRL